MMSDVGTGGWGDDRRRVDDRDGRATRRELLRRGLALGAAAFLPISSVGNDLWASDSETPSSGKTPEVPALAITLAQWSLHRTIFGGELDAVDFPVAAARCGIRGVEYVNQFYAARSDDRVWIADLRRR